MRKRVITLLVIIAIMLTGCNENTSIQTNDVSINITSSNGTIEMSPCERVYIEAPIPEIEDVQVYSSTLRVYTIDVIQTILCKKNSVILSTTELGNNTHLYVLDSGETVFIMPGMIAYDNMESQAQMNLIGLNALCLENLDNKESREWYENHLSLIASKLALPNMHIDNIQKTDIEALEKTQAERIENDPGYRKNVENGDFPYIDHWSSTDERIVVTFSFCIENTPILTKPFEMLDTTFVNELSGTAYYRNKELVALQIGAGIPSEIISTTSQSRTPSLDDVINTLRNKYTEIIFSNDIVFNSIELIYMPIPNKLNSFEITYVPVWQCKATQKYSDDDWELEKVIYIDAITGKEIR